MNYKDSVSKAIAYIEARLTEKLSSAEVAEAAGYSPYHFHRIFQSLTRTSVSEYISKRRLTRAAYDLFHTDGRIIEIALRYRFDSQEAFTRAFRKLFSVSPGQFRKRRDMKDTLFRAMEKLPLDDAGLRHLHEGISLEPSIVRLDELRLVGLSIPGLRSDEIGRLWRSFREREREIKRKPGTEGGRLFRHRAGRRGLGSLIHRLRRSRPRREPGSGRDGGQAASRSRLCGFFAQGNLGQT